MQENTSSLGINNNEDDQWSLFRKELEKRNSMIEKLDKQKLDMQLGQSYGINHQNINKNLQTVGNNSIAFYTGNVIVIKDMVTKQQQFIKKQGRLQNVTAICVDQSEDDNVETIVAAGESSVDDDQPGQLTVIHFEKNKWYSLINNQVKGTFKTISINQEKQYVATIIQPFNSLILTINVWNFKREKLLAQGQIKANIEKLILHPIKTKNIILQGQNVFKMWEIHFQEKIIKESHSAIVSQKIEKENRFLDSCWIKFKILTMLVLLQSRKILVLQNDQIKKIIEIDQSNLNLMEIQVSKPLQSEQYDDDLDINRQIQQQKQQKNQNSSQEINLTQQFNQKIDFMSIQATKSKGGFVLGGTKGVVCFFDLDSKTLNHINTQGFQMKNQQDDLSIVFLDVSKNDNIVTIITANLIRQQYWVMNTNEMDSDIQAIQPLFPCGYHNKKVNALSVAKLKTIFATCGEDNYLRIWNYGQNPKAIIQTYFNEEPIGLALHPTGLYLIVAFVNSFKIFTVMVDNISFVKEINLTSCRVVKYSHGGQYLIANEKWNIYVYDTLNYEPIYMLQGPTALIKEIDINLHDTIIVATCINRYVYMWNLQDDQTLLLLKKHICEELTTFNSIQCDLQVKEKKGTDYFIGCTNDKYLIIYKNQGMELVAEFQTSDCYITCLLICQKIDALLMGTNKGTVRISKWPITDDQLELEQIQPNSTQVKFRLPHYIEYVCHSSAITCLQINNDATHIFTASDDGNILVFYFNHNSAKNNSNYDSNILDNNSNYINANSQQNNNEERDKLINSMNDFFYNKIPKIQEKNEQIQKLKFEVQQSEKTLNIELSKIEQMFEQKISQIIQDFNNQKQNKESQLEKFIQQSKSDYTTLQQNFQENQHNFDIQKNKVLNNNINKVEYEIERNKQLEEEKKKINEEQKIKLQNLLRKHKEDLIKLKNQFQLKCKKIQLKYSTLLENAKNFGNAFIQRLDKQDEEHEKELEDSVKQLNQQIIQKRKVNDELQKKEKELSIIHQQNEKIDTDLQNELNSLLEKHSEIRAQNLRNDEDIVKMQHQLLERIQVIDGKEETCKNARDEQINLENFRYMLEQKIKMLQGEKDQIIEKINEKENNLKNMFNELILQSSKNQKNYLEFKHNNIKSTILKSTITSLDLQTIMCQQVYRNYQTYLLKIVQNPQKMVVMAQQLYDMLNQNQIQLKKDKSKPNSKLQFNNGLQQTSSNDVNEELLKQCQWMNQKIWLIGESCDKLKDQREQNINQILSQNTKLIEECNLLRSENDKLKKEYKNVKKQLVEQINKQQNIIKNKKNQENPGQLKDLMDKFQENNEKLQNQQNKLANLKSNMNQILDNKLPQI